MNENHMTSRAEMRRQERLQRRQERLRRQERQQQIQASVPNIIQEPTVTNKCMLEVIRGTVRIDFPRPHRPITVSAPDVVELPADRPHRVAQWFNALIKASSLL